MYKKTLTVWKTLRKTSPANVEMTGSEGILMEMLMKWSCDLGKCFDISDTELAQFLERPEVYAFVKQNLLLLLMAINDYKSKHL